ncbi:type VI secretion system baseplate subunit TssG [uncultured Roseibium sp.]|uniref:type VI secretion system baseplate subunit TssG n=1 Tax=uncultured Roseibium sp. TaxID=1936171 RepID=UPI00263660E7|nr:type VI secretion system baseplate subunit TssG [uncultured Roseibium sp.]
MSEGSNKDRMTKVKPKDDPVAADKTIVQFAGSKSAWPEPDETPSSVDPEPDEPLKSENPEADPTTAGTSLKEEVGTNNSDASTDADRASLELWPEPEDPILSPTTEAEAMKSDAENQTSSEAPAEVDKAYESGSAEPVSDADPSTGDVSQTSEEADENQTPLELWPEPDESILSPAMEAEPIQSDKEDQTSSETFAVVNEGSVERSAEPGSDPEPSSTDASRTSENTDDGQAPSELWPEPDETILSAAIETEATQADAEITASVEPVADVNDISAEETGTSVSNAALSGTEAAQKSGVADPVAADSVQEEDGPSDPDLSESTTVDTDAPEEVEPPVESRIEVPVQQQYASLLAALSERIQKHPGGHDLLAVLRMLEGQTAPGAASSGMGPKNSDEPAPPRIGKSRRLMEDIVRFGQDPSSEFPTSTIERATRDVDNGLILLERFLGMLGPQGALPSAYTDEAIMRGLQGEDSFPRFLDVFNNRFVQLFFRAWADARPIVQHDRPDDDRFLAYLGSGIGIGSEVYQNLDGIDDRLKLLFAGLTSAKTKSAARLKALITGVFGVDVEIDQCVGTWLHLEPDDQLSIGGFGPGGAGQLGMDTIVGSKIYSVSDKIRIRIFTSSLDEYRKFLPPTRAKPNPWTEKLFDLIDFYLGLEIEYEIELALPKRCASAVLMDSNSSATLGHIGWLKPIDADPADDADFDEDEEMLTDTRFRPVRRHTTVYQ